MVGDIFPIHINRGISRGTINNVPQLGHWNTVFDVDTQGVCHCHLTLYLPQERTATRHGVGTHKVRMLMKRRQRLMDSTEARPEPSVMPAESSAYVAEILSIHRRGRSKSNRGKWKMVGRNIALRWSHSPVALLVHSGASTYKGDGYHRGTVRAGMEGHSGIRDPESASKEVDKDIKITDTDLIMFPFGKHKGALSQVPSHIWTGCMKTQGVESSAQGL